MVISTASGLTPNVMASAFFASAIDSIATGASDDPLKAPLDGTVSKRALPCTLLLITYFIKSKVGMSKPGRALSVRVAGLAKNRGEAWCHDEEDSHATNQARPLRRIQ